MPYTKEDLIGLLKQAKLWLTKEDVKKGFPTISLEQGVKRIDRVIEILQTEECCK